MLKRIVLVIVAAVLVIATVAAGIFYYDKSQQKTDEEKKAEVLSLLESEDLINILGAQGLLKLWNLLPPEERKAALLSSLSSQDLIHSLGPEGILAILSKLKAKDLVNLLGPEEMLKILAKGKTGKYDKDFSLVNLSGSKPEALKDTERLILVQGIGGDGEVFFSKVGLSFVYSQDYVVAPIQLFYFYGSPFDFAYTLFDLSNTTVKTFLLLEKEKEGWVKEELGEIKINKDLGIAVIERPDPIANVYWWERYSLGTFEDLQVGDASYQVSKLINDQLLVEPLNVAGLFTDEKGRKLISYQGPISLFEVSKMNFGGLVFAIRNGEFELVGFLSIVKPTQDYQIAFFAIDINQIIDYIEKEIKK